MHKVNFSLAPGSALIGQLRRLWLLCWIPQNLRWQLVLAVSVTWTPLLIFTAVEGLALGAKVEMPFIADLVQYARFLIALPCAIALGTFINPRLERVLNSFLKTGAIRSKDLPDFEHVILRAKTLTYSVIVELGILAFVYSYTWLGLHRQPSSGISSWGHPSQAAFTSQPAGQLWFLWVSMPLFLFAMTLWLWRLGVWAYLLLRISRLDLRIIATHPDHAGGLNFINVGMRRFSVLVFAVSSILCASIGDEILFRGASVQSYELELSMFFLVCLAVILGPLLVFTPMLIRLKLEAWGRYSVLASRYVQGFDEKWTQHTDYSDDTLLGTPDIQSLADLGHSYAGISEMRTLLPSRSTIAAFALAYALPALPLLATIISLRRIISELYTLLLK